MKNPVQLASYVFTLIMVAIVGTRMVRTEPCVPGFSNRGTSPVIDSSRLNPGYTVIAPLFGSRERGKVHSVYLMDMWGRSVHEWKTRMATYQAILKKNGNLLVALVSGTPAGQFARSRIEAIQELNWNSEVIWEYRNDWMHHGLDVLPNGNIAVVQFDRIPKKIAKQIRGGRAHTEYDGDMWADVIKEISPEKKVVWEWKSYEHLSPSQYPLPERRLREEWTHANSLKYLEKNPINQEPGYLVSFRELHKVIIAGKQDGKILWESPDGLFFGQHDPSLLENGNLLVFNNGEESSEIIEMDLKSRKVVWSYSAGETGVDKMQFFSVNQGAAQRLKNGNTFIAESTRGHLFEITPDGSVVWDMISPFGSKDPTGPWLHNNVFRPQRYDFKEIQWPEKLPDPLSKAPLFCQAILMENVRSYFSAK
jgi:hypothetical protein